MKTVLSPFKGALWLGCKLSYPVLGNLSWKVQNYLEEKLGRENYDSTHAFMTSMVTNPFVYSIGAVTLANYYGSHEENKTPWEFALIPPAFYLGVVEAVRRVEIIDRSDKTCCSSLFGKIVSLPVEGVMFGCGKIREGLNNYCVSLEKRIEDGVSKEIRMIGDKELKLRKKIVKPVYGERKEEQRKKDYESALESESKEVIMESYNAAIKDNDFIRARNLANKLGTEAKINVAKAEHDYLGALIDYQTLPLEIQDREVEPYLTQFLYNGSHSAGRKIEEEDVKILDIDRAGSKHKENA